VVVLFDAHSFWLTALCEKRARREMHLISISSCIYDQDRLHPSVRLRIGSRLKIAKLHRQGGPKLLHRRVGRQKATHNTTTKFLKPRSRVHDVAVEDDGALDVTDLADDYLCVPKT
jgi:hypothetical protein